VEGGSLQDFLARLAGVKRKPATATSPVARHTTISTSRCRRGRRARHRLNCHAGCRPEDVARRVDIELRISSTREPDRRSSSLSTSIATRTTSSSTSSSVAIPKDFRQRRPDGNGGWIWNLKGVTPLPYRLPELLGAPVDDVIFIVEGEKDVDALQARGFSRRATAAGQGSGSHGALEMARPADTSSSSRTTTKPAANTRPGARLARRHRDVGCRDRRARVSNRKATSPTGSRPATPSDELRELVPKVVASTTSIASSTCTVRRAGTAGVDLGRLDPRNFVTTLYAMGGSVEIVSALNTSEFRS
jgi:hypothetical protein